MCEYSRTTDKKTVCHIITGLKTGGAEAALFNLLKGGLATRFNSQVISLTDEGGFGPRINALGVQVITLNMRRNTVSPLGLLKFRRTIKRIKPDLIQGWMYHGNLFANLAHHFSDSSSSLIWNIRQSLYDLKYQKIMTKLVIRTNRCLSKRPDVLLYNSHRSKKQHEVFGFSSEKGRVIPNGIDVQRFNVSGEASKRIRTELGVPANSVVVGHIARLHPMKGHPAFLRVSVDLALRYPKTHFLLSGRNVSLDSRTLAQLIPEQVRDRFHLLGERGDVPELLSAMDIVCQSSASEAFPNVLCEAMASGVPCVATDVGDSAMIVGDTGVIVPAGDDAALSAGIENLLMMPLKKRHLLGVRARSRIESNFDLATIVKEYAELYETMGRVQK